jgi:hypothetical protein
MVCKGIVFIFYFTNKFNIFFITSQYTCIIYLIAKLNRHFYKSFKLYSLVKNVSYKQVPSRFFPKENFCKLTIERKTGTPVFQKTAAKEIKNL